MTRIYLNKFCVYIHYVDGKILYIGAGVASRPFQTKHKSRATFWHKHADNATTIDVEIVGWFDSKKEALAEERRLILFHNPPGNMALRKSLSWEDSPSWYRRTLYQLERNDPNWRQKRTEVRAEEMKAKWDARNRKHQRPVPEGLLFNW